MSTIRRYKINSSVTLGSYTGNPSTVTVNGYITDVNGTRGAALTQFTFKFWSQSGGGWSCTGWGGSQTPRWTNYYRSLSVGSYGWSSTNNETLSGSSSAYIALYDTYDSTFESWLSSNAVLVCTEKDIEVHPLSNGTPDTSKVFNPKTSIEQVNGLTTQLSAKQDKLTAGDNITISGTTISATNTTYTAGTNVQISNNVISATDTTYTAGTGVTITDNVIAGADLSWSEVVPTYTVTVVGSYDGMPRGLGNMYGYVNRVSTTGEDYDFKLECMGSLTCPTNPLTDVEYIYLNNNFSGTYTSTNIAGYKIDDGAITYLNGSQDATITIDHNCTLTVYGLDED